MSPLRIQAEKSVLKKISIGTLAVLGGAAFAYMGKKTCLVYTNTHCPLLSWALATTFPTASPCYRAKSFLFFTSTLLSLCFNAYRQGLQVLVFLLVAGAFFLLLVVAILKNLSASSSSIFTYIQRSHLSCGLKLLLKSGKF